MSNEEQLDRMPEEDYEYAIASQIAYDYYDNNNDANQTQRILDTYLDGYTFDPRLSYNNSSVIVRPNGSAILAYRGTRPNNLDDLNADASILAGQHRTDNPHPRFIEANNHYNLVKNTYTNVDITGHSLGGTLADYVGRTNGERAIVFNPGETPFSLNVIPSGNSRTTIYRTNTFDIVSFSNSMYPHANRIRVVPQRDPTTDFLASHNLTNFLPPQSMLPISTEPDIIIPDVTPVLTEQEQKQQRQEFKQQEKIIKNICLEQPYLLECQKSEIFGTKFSQKLRPKLIAR